MTNSPSAGMNTSRLPAIIPGRERGRVISRKTLKGLAPRKPLLLPLQEYHNNLDLFHDTHQKRGKLTLSQIAAPLFPNINPPRVTPVRLPDRLAGIGTIFRFDNQVDVVMTCFNIVDSYQQVIKKIIVSKAVTLQSMLNVANGKTSW